jgi:hypothetical protein
VVDSRWVLLGLVGCQQAVTSSVGQAVSIGPDSGPVLVAALACPEGTMASGPPQAVGNTINCPTMLTFAAVWNTLSGPCAQATAAQSPPLVVGKWYYWYTTDCSVTSGTALPASDARYANNAPYCLLFPDDPARYVSGCELPPANPPAPPQVIQVPSGSFGPFDDVDSCTAAQNARRNTDATGECRGYYSVFYGNPDGIGRVERLDGTCCL